LIKSENCKQNNDSEQSNHPKKTHIDLSNFDFKENENLNVNIKLKDKIIILEVKINETAYLLAEKLIKSEKLTVSEINKIKLAYSILNEFNSI